MALQKGKWTFNANGSVGVLDITGDAGGKVTGTLTMNGRTNQLDNVAFWNDASKELTFIRMIDPAKPSSFQIYKGYAFQKNSLPILAGSFDAFGSGSASRSVYGWIAEHQPSARPEPGQSQASAQPPATNRNPGSTRRG
jgi:hypothetical protein